MGLYRPLRKLGPDLLGDPIDFAEIVRRARVPAEGDLVANVLLDQTIASGVGNVYKSEVLFLRGIDPRTAIADLREESLIAMYRETRQQMQQNVRRAHRSTTGSTIHRLWVYGRAGSACFRCSSAIAHIRQGGRSTYWCPSCQPELRAIGDLASARAVWRAR